MINTIWTTQQVAEVPDYSVAYVWNLARTGIIPCYQVSQRSYRFDPGRVRAWIEVRGKGWEELPDA